MKIEYLGHSCFLVEGTSSLMFDPFHNIGYDLKKTSCDYVFCSHDHFDHNAKELVSHNLSFGLNSNSGVAGNIVYSSLLTNHDEFGGKKRGRNAVFKVILDGVVLAHLGDVGEVTDELLEFVSDADALFIPVGGKYTIDYTLALKIIDSVAPTAVFPMHYKLKKSNVDVADLKNFLTANTHTVKIVKNPYIFDFGDKSNTCVYLFDNFLK
ncbi:MAG: MBL fold metallo-hydrolase [Christensenellaceae bacterium]